MTVTGVGARYGLILGAELILYGIIFRVLNIHYSSPLSWIFYLILPVTTWVALRAFRSSTDGMPPFAKSVGLAAMVVAIGSALYSVFVFGFNRFIDDSLLVTVRADRTAQLHERGLTGDELARALARLQQGTTPAVFSLNVFIALLVFGVVTSLVVALFMTRRSRPAAATVPNA